MRFEVTVTNTAVAHERPSSIRVFAKNAKEAISRARQAMASMGYTRQDGPFSYSATKWEE